LTESDDLLLWAGSVREYGWADRIAAAHAGGFSVTSLFPADIQRAEREGISRDELSAMFADAGISIAVIDPFTKWLPSWSPGPTITEAEIAFADFDEREVFAMAHAFGAEVISLNEFFGEPVDAEVAAECFAALSDRAAGEGLRIMLEPMPFSGVGDLALAWEIVRMAGRANGGLILDAWHFFRRGPDLELLASIPGDRIFAVQLDDAPAKPEASVKDESMHRRLLPGAGELDLEGFMRAVAPPVGRRYIGPEIFSDEAWRWPAGELGQRLGATTRRLLASLERVD
jgi:sugar phosphate isomerase/epimerase